MEQQLTNEEVARVFAMYMPCPVIMGNNNFNQTLVAVGGFNDAGYCYGKLKNDASTSAQFINNFQLLITPLSAITDEHAIEMYNAFSFVETNFKEEAINVVKEHILVNISQGLIEWEIREYLISKGYTMPLWFGVNHWANGKTAIELGIAIENK